MLHNTDGSLLHYNIDMGTGFELPLMLYSFLTIVKRIQRWNSVKPLLSLLYSITPQL